MTKAAILSLHSGEESGDGKIRYSASLREPDGFSQKLWWELPVEWREAVTQWADPWLVGFIFPAMQKNRPVHVEGAVSPSLLANLDLLMHVWQVWRPARYRPVLITADFEEELPPPSEPDRCVTSYSAGLDSNYSIYRHVKKLIGRRSRQIGAGIVQHGFDVVLDQLNSQAMFNELFERARKTLSGVGVPCIPIRSNFRELDVEWPEAYGSQLISGLSLLSARFGAAIFPNDLPFHRLGIKPWASHPLTNVLMQSNNFQVVDDGGETSRIEKIKVVGGWPDAFDNLRVCYGVAVPGSLSNCCRCEKCVRTLLACRIAGLERPRSFVSDASDRTIRDVRLTSLTKVEYWKELARCSSDAGLDKTSWARAINDVLAATRRREVRKNLQAPFVPIRDAFRKLARNSTLSRSEAAQEAIRQRRRHGPAPS